MEPAKYASYRKKLPWYMEIGAYEDVKDLDNYPHDFKVGFATMPRLSENQDKNLTTSYTERYEYKFKVRA